MVSLAESYALLLVHIAEHARGAFAIAAQDALLTVAAAVAGCTIVAVDRARTAARADEERYRSLFETRAVGVLVADCERRLVAGNQRLAEILGYDHPDELVGISGADLTFPGDPDPVGPLAARLFTGELERYTTETRYRRKDGTGVWIRVGGAAIPNTDCYFSFLEDISDAKLAQQELHEKTLLLERAQQVGGVGTWVWDAATNCTDWSDEARRIYGFEDVEADTRDASLFWRVVHPDDREEIERLLTASIATAGVCDLEHRIVRPDGEVRWVRARGDVESGADGVVVRQLGAIIDVTEEKLAQEELKEVHRLAKLGSWAWSVDDGDLTAWSDSFSRMLGRDPALPIPSAAERSRYYTDETRERLDRLFEETLRTGCRGSTSSRWCVRMDSTSGCGRAARWNETPMAGS